MHDDKWLNALSGLGWESEGETIGSVLVEVQYEPTMHEVNMPRFLKWLKQAGRNPHEEKQKQMLL